jgi:hypothetical protein
MEVIKMIKSFYEYESKAAFTNDMIREYCMAEQLNEEYFRYTMRENEAKNHSAMRNIMAAAILTLADIFKR